MRQIVLDTETTGLEPAQGHRIIEIGCVELIDRRPSGNHFHQYLQPDRDIDAGAIEVHGITNEFLEDKPRFADVVDEFIDFVKDAELIIHNAPFDVGFINHEFALLKKKRKKIESICTVLDTLQLARHTYPGQRNSLDALCKRLEIDNSQRTLHGALLDAEILADVYLTMTGGQSSLLLDGAEDSLQNQVQPVRQLDTNRPALKIIRASEEEVAEHQARLAALERESDGNCVWNRLEASKDTLINTTVCGESVEP